MSSAKSERFCHIQYKCLLLLRETQLIAHQKYFKMNSMNGIGKLCKRFARKCLLPNVKYKSNGWPQFRAFNCVHSDSTMQINCPHFFRTNNILWFSKMSSILHKTLKLTPKYWSYFNSAIWSFNGYIQQRKRLYTFLRAKY